jgi:lysophospholipase L1-like esterase
MRKPHAFGPTGWDLLEGRIVPSQGGAAGAANLVQAADVSTPTADEAATPAQRLDPGAVEAHSANVAMADSGGASNVVFFGDSIMARWHNVSYPGLAVWNAEIAPLSVADFGVDGDRTQNLIWRMQNGELDGQPKVAVVLIGTNNLLNAAGDESPDETVAGITAVVQTIRNLSPQTKVLLLGLLPRSTPGDPVRGEVQQVNGQIAGLQDGTNVFYGDLGSLFLGPDGSIPTDLLPDGIHPSLEGYQLMADYLVGPLSVLLGLAIPAPTTYGGPILVDPPPNQVAEAPDMRGALLQFTPPLAFDALDPDPVIASTPPRGTILPLGTTVVTATATDRYGHVASASFSVEVRPAAPPVLQDVPGDAVVEATGPLGAVVNFALPTGTDVADPDVSVICVPPSGSTFPIGTTTVTCTATDQAGDVTGASFTIRVRDATPPAFLSLPNLVVEATGASGAAVYYSQLRVVDLVDPAPSVTYSKPSGSTFPIGLTVVSCTASDLAGNLARAAFTVTVNDTPVLHNPPPSQVVAKTRRTGAVVRFTPPTATDVANPNIKVASSMPSGATFPVGTTVVNFSATGVSGVTTTDSMTITVVGPKPPTRVPRSTVKPAPRPPRRTTVVSHPVTPSRAGTWGQRGINAGSAPNQDIAGNGRVTS